MTLIPSLIPIGIHIVIRMATRTMGPQGISLYPSSLADHVMDVIALCTDKYMIRINTTWNIALMAHTKPIRYRSVLAFPQQSMHPKAPSLYSKDGIALIVNGLRP